MLVYQVEINSLGKMISSFHVSVSTHEHENIRVLEDLVRLLCEVPGPKYVKEMLTS